MSETDWEHSPLLDKLDDEERQSFFRIINRKHQDYTSYTQDEVMAVNLAASYKLRHSINRLEETTKKLAEENQGIEIAVLMLAIATLLIEGILPLITDAFFKAGVTAGIIIAAIAFILFWKRIFKKK